LPTIGVPEKPRNIANSEVCILTNVSTLEREELRSKTLIYVLKIVLETKKLELIT
jgi:hypothetical protein